MHAFYIILLASNVSFCINNLCQRKNFNEIKIRSMFLSPNIYLSSLDLRSVGQLEEFKLCS